MCKSNVNDFRGTGISPTFSKKVILHTSWIYCLLSTKFMKRCIRIMFPSEQEFWSENCWNWVERSAFTISIEINSEVTKRSLLAQSKLIYVWRSCFTVWCILLYHIRQQNCKIFCLSKTELAWLNMSKAKNRSNKWADKP